MPLKPGKGPGVVSQNIRELHTGKTYAHTSAKFGKAKANKQAIAIALSNARKYAEGGSAGYPNPWEDIGKYTPKGPTSKPEPLDPNPLQFWEHPSPRRVIPIREHAEGGNIRDADPANVNTDYIPLPVRIRMQRETDARAAQAAGVKLPPPLQVVPKAYGGPAAPKPPGLAKPVPLGGPPKAQNIDLNPSEGIERLAMRGSIYGLRHEGMINSAIPGRTDKLPMNVKAGSYVLPADIPSALGQGNSMAGGAILKKMFSSGPAGPAMRGAGRTNMPHMNFMKPPTMGSMGRMGKMGFAQGGKGPKKDPRAPLNPLDPATHLGTPQIPFSGGSSRSQSGRYEYDPDNPDLGGYEHARGGTNREQPRGAESGMDEQAEHVPIIAAGGEYIIDPSVVRDIGHGDIKAGHRVLDKFVLNTRKKHIDTLKKLKPPKK